MSYPTVMGNAVSGLLYREAQSCLGSQFAGSTYQFFLSGTTTPADVYEDGALSTPFPIQGYVSADSYGRFPPIYTNNLVIYKVRFYDSTNTLQWTVDPYVPPLATTGTYPLSTYSIKLASTGEVSILAPSLGGTGVTLTLNAGALGSAPLQISAPIPGASALIVNSSATTGAQTATFTAANKPGTAASSPAGWLPITCDGVQYYTPIWHGNSFTPYVANPAAAGEAINASSVAFGGNGLTTATGGTANPGSWYVPNSANIGAGYYLKITKTSGLSGVNFSAANGTWANITSGGLAISTNAYASISGTYQISTSGSGTPVVAAGTITLSHNNGVTSNSWNGATPLVLASDGTATLNGVSTSNWYSPTTGSVGTGIYIKITQTGGTAGYSFSAATSYTQIGAGLSIGISGTGSTSFNVTGTYIIASDSGGVNQLGSGTITLSGTSGPSFTVQSPNWSGTTPLVLSGNGTATLNGVGTSAWGSPTTSNVGSGYWIDITRTSGPAGVNFSTAQGSWTNITNSGLSIGMTGYTGDVGTITVGGTWKISSSSSGTPVLGSGSISLSVNAGTVTHTYTSGSGTETVPTGATRVVITAWGGGASGANSNPRQGFGGGSGAYVQKTIAVVGGNTLSYAIGTGGAAPSYSGQNNGTASTVSGTVSGGSVAVSAGGGQNTGSAAPGGTASGGDTNTNGNAGTANVGGSGGSAPNGGAGGANSSSANGTAPGGGGGGYVLGGTGGAGAAGKLTFLYS